ncbi:hypothetical protein OG589_13250 [Sphaerisporangium sp. NBC_01403]|uniref:hypothetical protein n=1 Tax=Sphaerisporangium sp. NBC_01403 TaxID=2903599 RepID=UPI003250F935
MPGLSERAAAHPVFEHRLDEALTGLCARHPRVTAEPAIQVVTQVEAPGPLLAVLQHLLDDRTTTPADLVRWSGELPRTSYALAGWAADLSTRLVDHYRGQTDPSDLPDLAASLKGPSSPVEESNGYSFDLQRFERPVAWGVRSLTVW